MTPRAPAPLARLAETMEQRARELGLTWEDVHAAGGPAVRTLNNLRRARSAPDRATLAKLDAGLRWQPGSAQAVLDGADPVPLPSPGRPQADGDWRPQALGAGYAVAEITAAEKLKAGILEAFAALPAGTPPDQAGELLFPDSPPLAAAWDAAWAASPEDPAGRAEPVAWIVALGHARRSAGERASRRA